MEVIIQPTAQAAVKLTARLLADALDFRPDMVLGLSTGTTMEGVFAELSRMYREERLDFSQARTFNLDEYIGIAPNHPGSFHNYMAKHLFNNINIKKANTNLPNGMTEDIAGEGARYEAAIRAAGGIDFQLLSIGVDGHIGFNEPLSSLGSRTRAKTLTPETYRKISQNFNPPESTPRRAITMGVGTILDAKRIVLLVTGAHKAEILAKAVEGPVTSMVSASAIQYHRNAVAIVDEEAATLLQGQEYYRWNFENEPGWAKYR